MSHSDILKTAFNYTTHDNVLDGKQTLNSTQLEEGDGKQPACIDNGNIIFIHVQHKHEQVDGWVKRFSTSYSKKSIQNSKTDNNKVTVLGSHIVSGQ